MFCDNCGFEVSSSWKLCPNCGTQLANVSEVLATDQPAVNVEVVPQESDTSLSENASIFENPRKLLTIIGGAVVLLIGIGSLAGGGGSSGGNLRSNPITVEQFGCSYGTTVASAIVRNNSNQAVNAFVTVGLYAGNGTLQFDATEYGMVEAGGTRLINVKLGGYQFLVGDCRIIAVGY